MTDDTHLRLVLATQNEGKIVEVREALADLPLELLSAAEAGIDAFPEETGSSYEENALLKAGFAALRSGLPALADDSGLEVDALDGAPGIYSARFGGKLSPGERIAYLLERIKEVPAGERGASLVGCMVLATPGGEVRSFFGSCRGEILEGPRGEGGFGYGRIFRSADLGITFGEASVEEKRRVSHRGRALRAFRAWLEDGGVETLKPAPSRPRS